MAVRHGRFKVKFFNQELPHDNYSTVHCTAGSPHGEFFQTWNCYGKGITYYDPPLIHDIESDKSELYPLDPTTPENMALLQAVMAAVAAHNKTLGAVGSGVSGQQPTQLGTPVKENQPWGCGAPPVDPSAPVVGQCLGGPGDDGWQVLNHTGGGGPGFESLPGFNLSLASVNECRAKCCASDRCVSITMGPAEESGDHMCWLNPARCGGANHPCTSPFPQETTLMAFVKRANHTDAHGGPHGGGGGDERRRTDEYSSECKFNYPNRDPQL